MNQDISRGTERRERPRRVLCQRITRLHARRGSVHFAIARERGLWNNKVFHGQQQRRMNK